MECGRGRMHDNVISVTVSNSKYAAKLIGIGYT